MNDWRTPVERMMHTSPADWDVWQIAALTPQETPQIAAMLGLPKSAEKARIVFAVRLRIMLAPYGETYADVQALADRYKGRHLRWFCRLARVFRGANKCALAAGLLQWRKEARRRGEAAVKEFRARDIIENGGQRRLPLK